MHSVHQHVQYSARKHRGVGRAVSNQYEMDSVTVERMSLVANSLHVSLTVASLLKAKHYCTNCSMTLNESSTSKHQLTRQLLYLDSVISAERHLL